MSDLYALPVSFKFERPTKDLNDRMNKEGKFLFLYSAEIKEPAHPNDPTAFLPDTGWVYAKDEADARSKFPSRVTNLSLEKAEIRKSPVEDKLVGHFKMLDSKHHFAERVGIFIRKQHDSYDFPERPALTLLDTTPVFIVTNCGNTLERLSKHFYTGSKANNPVVITKQVINGFTDPTDPGTDYLNTLDMYCLGHCKHIITNVPDLLLEPLCSKVIQPPYKELLE